jgi:hypothetical protein
MNNSYPKNSSACSHDDHVMSEREIVRWDLPSALSPVRSSVVWQPTERLAAARVTSDRPFLWYRVCIRKTVTKHWRL